jgi:hypothetical protein
VICHRDNSAQKQGAECLAPLGASLHGELGEVVERRFVLYGSKPDSLTRGSKRLPLYNSMMLGEPSFLVRFVCADGLGSSMGSTTLRSFRNGVPWKLFYPGYAKWHSECWRKA